MDSVLSDKYFLVDSLFPQWLFDVETQAVILAGLCCVGAWVIFQWIMQIMFSVLWPFFLVATILIMLPALRKNLATNYFPKHVEALKCWISRFINCIICPKFGRQE